PGRPRRSQDGVEVVATRARLPEVRAGTARRVFEYRDGHLAPRVCPPRARDHRRAPKKKLRRATCSLQTTAPSEARRTSRLAERGRPGVSFPDLLPGLQNAEFLGELLRVDVRPARAVPFLARIPALPLAV